MPATGVNGAIVVSWKMAALRHKRRRSNKGNAASVMQRSNAIE
jgi:hypothetical protein